MWSLRLTSWGIWRISLRRSERMGGWPRRNAEGAKDGGWNGGGLEGGGGLEDVSGKAGGVELALVEEGEVVAEAGGLGVVVGDEEDG